MTAPLTSEETIAMVVKWLEVRALQHRKESVAANATRHRRIARQWEERGSEALLIAREIKRGDFLPRPAHKEDRKDGR